MKLSSKESALLDRAIEQWEDEQLIDPGLAKKLQSSYDADADDYKTLSFYSFFAAISCALLAFGALVLDDKWIERMRRYFAFSEFTIALAFALIAVVLTLYLIKRKKKYINTIWANESLSILLGLCTCVAFTYLGKGLAQNDDQYYWIILIAGLGMGLEAILVKSKVLWLGLLTGLVGWFSSFSVAYGDPFFFGMNMPLRLFFFSAILLLVHYLICRFTWMSSFEEMNRKIVWIMLLLAAWGCSVYGNFSMEEWFTFRQTKMIPWALGFTILLVLVLYFAIKSKNRFLRDLSLVFIIIDIYTRYFEYFWQRTNKGIFFALLGLSFWFIGKRIEHYRKRSKLNQQ